MTSSANTSAGRRIVVGVDRSLSARVALEHAARRVGEDGNLVVAHAMVPLLDVDLGGGEWARRRASHRRPGACRAAGRRRGRADGDPDRGRHSRRSAGRAGKRDRRRGDRRRLPWHGPVHGRARQRLTRAARPRRPSGRRGAARRGRPPAATLAGSVAARLSSATTGRSRRARHWSTPSGAPAAAGESSPCTRSSPRRIGWGRRTTSVRSTRARRAAGSCWGRSSKSRASWASSFRRRCSKARPRAPSSPPPTRATLMRS